MESNVTKTPSARLKERYAAGRDKLVGLGGWIDWRTRFAGKCTSSGLPFAENQRVVYYPTTRKMHLMVCVMPGDAAMLNPDSACPQFRYVEACFRRWFDRQCQQDSRFAIQFEGPDALRTVRGAIDVALEDAYALAIEQDRAIYLHEFDLESSWT